MIKPDIWCLSAAAQLPLDKEAKARTHLATTSELRLSGFTFESGF